jgi:hypothetical protein
MRELSFVSPPDLGALVAAPLFSGIPFEASLSHNPAPDSGSGRSNPATAGEGRLA